ncbi:MAG: right-handed parallel beta-helix repeat-containing protein [Archangium sp.]|nr:right-handed parallel beta-helix repeat-containing protein [Archangium sp.]
MKTLLSWSCCALLLLAVPAQARDWFVREGASGGDGSMNKPFGDPWQALDKCEANDAIHVAGGKYFGRSNTGYWVIPFDGVQLIGGYDKDFKERDPWKNLTQLLWDKTSKNWPKEVRLGSNAKNTVVDGLVLDMREQNKYADDAQTGRAADPGQEHAMRFSMPVTVRNSIIINPGENGIVCSQGSTLENNLVLNALVWGVVINSNSAEAKSVATVKNNTIAFSYDDRAAGKGGYAGAAIAVKGAANISNNILINSDNSAVYMSVLTEKVSLTGNVFFQNLFANLSFGVDGRTTSIDDSGMDSLDEVGLKAFEGNEVKNPQLEFDPKWMDKASKRTAAQPGKLVMDDWNKSRQLLGLPMIEKGGAGASGIAPAYELDWALKLFSPKANVKAGARKLKLEVKLQGGDSGPQRSYTKSELSSWLASPASVDGKPLEIVVAIGSVANIQGIPSSFKKDDHAGADLYETTGEHRRVIGFFKKGSSAQRVIEENSGWYRGQGNPDRLFLARGVAYALSGVVKGGFFVDSIEAYDASASAAAAARPAGRDWFVRAGASGGDGSRSKPFKDPWQALEKLEAGDSVHVAEGEYWGKLKAGTWKIDTTNVALIGGYDKDFTERNPWTHPTRLLTPADFKGTKGGYTIEGVDDHSGAIVDGFIFDKKTLNQYESDGDLQYDKSDKTEHIWLARPGCIIRNNVFLNGASAALRVAGGQTIENNIFINHVYRTVNAGGGFGGTFVFRNNTVLFSWDPVRFGEGHGSNGNLLSLEGRVEAVVDNNIFEFADNDAIRMAVEAKDVELTNNTFSKNLWSVIQRTTDWTAVDEKEFNKLEDLKFKKCSGNQLLSSGVPLERTWFDVYLSRVAPVRGKVQMDDWNQLRELMGQPVIATGGKPGSGFAPAYDWAKAVQLFPKNPKVKAGARASTFPAKFTGKAPEAEVAYDYDETTWDVARSKDDWEKLVGKRVSLKLVIRSTDNQYFLDDIKKDDYTCFTAIGPEGNDSPGLPLRLYVKKGTRPERVVRQAKSYSSGPVQQTYVIKGVVRSNRQMVAEAVERAD